MNYSPYPCTSWPQDLKEAIGFALQARAAIQPPPEEHMETGGTDTPAHLDLIKTKACFLL